ncbi:MAG: hypothetical protein L0H31_15465 [Nocardioidaceae bacterium]|nr:hypothetical protein [Nocardioidaceae bacterium]
MRAVSWMGVLWVVLALLLGATAAATGEAGKQEDACSNVGATFASVTATCSTDGDSGAKDVSTSAVRFEPVCFDDPCTLTVKCHSLGGPTGVLYDKHVDDNLVATNICVVDRDSVELTPGAVLRAMRRLSWPASKLTIQPPDGLTLVNFDTNFYTDDTAAVTKTVRLLGQRVVIEATPSEFRFNFGDDRKLETTDPGAAYPALRVTHNYLLKGSYRPWLSTTYSGRFKVGNGRWQDIPGTVTAHGPKQRLRAVEATPKLVGY